MTKEKQIEEIEKIASKCTASWLNNETPKPLPDYIAHAIYNADYRKASEFAREIVTELERYLRLNEDIAKKCKEENGEQNQEYFKGKLSAFLQIRGFIDVELKSQYKEW